MFDKKQKRCVNRIHLVTDDGLYDRKAFYTVKIVFYSSSLKNAWFAWFHLTSFQIYYLQLPDITRYIISNLWNFCLGVNMLSLLSYSEGHPFASVSSNGNISFLKALIVDSRPL